MNKHFLLKVCVLLSLLSPNAQAVDILNNDEGVTKSTIKSLPLDIEKTNKWNFSLYTETYKSLINFHPILFARFSIMNTDFLIRNGSFITGFESYNEKLLSATEFEKKTQWTYFIGYNYKLLPILNILGTYRAENINSNSEGTSKKGNTPLDSVLRLGLYGSHFNYINSLNSFFLDSYYELFSQVNGFKRTESLSMGSANFKLGYRLNQFLIPSLTFDPLIFELRGYSTNRIDLAGSPYTVLNIGMRFSYFQLNPNLSSSLFITQSQRIDKTNLKSTPWVLFSFGGSF